MPRGQVLDSRSTAAQGNEEAQFSSAAKGEAAHATMTEHAGPDCEQNRTAPTSNKEARVAAKATCAQSSPQVDVQRRSFLL